MVLKRVHLDYRKKRIVVIIFTALLLLMIYLFKDASFLLRAVSTIVCLVFFYSVDHIFDIRFRPKHYVYFTLILIFSFLFSPFYFYYPSYDKVQHFIQPMLICSIVFYMVNKLNLELKWKILFTFFIVVAILGIFEISEYALDSFFNLKLQGVYLRDERGLDKFNLILDPLSDTMMDMMWGMLGVGIYSIGFAWFMRKRLRTKIFRDF